MKKKKKKNNLKISEEDKSIDVAITKPSGWDNMRPKQRLQLNNSLSRSDLDVKNDLGLFKIPPCFKAHIRPTEEIKLIIIKLL